jgi:sec-independent protein translocase protein TatA
MGISTTHLIIFLVIIVLIFGTKEAQEHRLGPRLGREGLQGRHEDGRGEQARETAEAMQAKVAGPDQRASAENTIDVEAKPRS